MNRVGALTAAGANHGIKRLDDGVVKKREGFLPPADTHPAKQLDRRRPDQEGTAELELEGKKSRTSTFGIENFSFLKVVENGGN
jgi:hypothetical protein